MKKLKVVREKRERVIGWTTSTPDKILAHDHQGSILGWYLKKEKKTVDKSGRVVVSKGNATRALIFAHSP